jgi:hypothetical protein
VRPEPQAKRAAQDPPEGKQDRQVRLVPRELQLVKQVSQAQLVPLEPPRVRPALPDPWEKALLGLQEHRVKQASRAKRAA